MKKQFFNVLAVIMWCVWLCGISNASGKALGIGGGLSAVADDVFAIGYNPAGLCRIPFPELGTSIDMPSIGLNDGTSMRASFLAYAYPFARQRTTQQAVAMGWNEFAVSNLYAERTLSFAYARSIISRLSAGITLKQMSRNYGNQSYMHNAINNQGDIMPGVEDPFFSAAKSKKAVTGDLGALYRFGSFNRYSVGMALLNITQPNLALGSSEDRVPFMLVTGFAYRFPKLNASVDWMRGRMLAAGSENRIVAVGERWFIAPKKTRIAVRGSLTSGTRNLWQLGLGFSWLYRQIRLDYGFGLPLTGITQIIGAHTLSCSYRFGYQDPEEDFSPELHEKRLLRRAAEQALEYARKEMIIAKQEREKASVEIETLQKKVHEMESIKATERAEAAEKKARERNTESYRISMESYDKAKNAGTDIGKRVHILEGIVADYEAHVLDISEAKTELAKVRQEKNKLEEEYHLTIYYYQKLVERGASTSDRSRFLKRILNKYENTGIDIGEVHQEIKKLK